MRLYLLYMTRIVAFFIFLLFGLLIAYGQSDYSLYGSLKVTNYSSKDYKGNPQVFSISQSEEGVMFFTNMKGVLEYDGENWVTHPLPDKAESLNLINTPRFFVTSTSGLGEFVINEKGQFEYVGRNENLPEDIKEYYNVVYFEGNYLISDFQHVIVLNEDLQVIDKYTNSDQTISDLSVLSDGVYFRGAGNDIVSYDGSDFNVNIKTPFDSENPVVSIFEFNGEKIFVTQDGRLFGQYAGSLYEVYSDENLSVKTVIPIDDKFISIGTYVDGVVILDRKFEPVYRVNTNRGLNDGTILSQFVDAEKNLWLGTSNGISKIDLMSPVITYQNLFNEATIEDLAVFQDELVMATGGGAYILNKTGHVEKIHGIDDDCYGLKELPTQDGMSLFISALYDVFLFDGNEVKSIAQGGPYNVVQSPFDKNVYVVLHYDGLQVLKYSNGTYQQLCYESNFSEGEPFNFIITDEGDIWIGTKPNDGVYRINIKTLGTDNVSFQRYYTDEGLPTGQTYLVEYEGEIYCATDFGAYKFNGEKFEPTSQFGIDFSKTGQGVHRISADPLGNVWMVLFMDEDNTVEIGYSDKSEGYVWHSEYFSGYNEYIVHSIYHQDENVTWLGGPGGLMSFDKRRVATRNANFKTLIREVSFGEELLYGGNGLFQETYELNYGSKDKVEFIFAANTFHSEDKTQYSFRLEGYDDQWSEWTSTTKEDYSLSEGTYTFKVKARNAHGDVSEEVSFTFTILPPWYRTWWAYTLFFIGLVILIYILIRLSIRRVKQQNIKLEKIVDERTQEVVAQKAEAEKQRDIAEHQKHLVEEKNVEILDSINYAKRLQNAILTPVKTIYDTFEESFILYLPKDIVAGDFYWTNLAKFNKREKRNMIAAADCTGHGVPGAMVSVVCSNALDRSVKEFGLTKPSEVLDKTTDLVIETFEKSEDEVKDGMDISLCAFEKREDGVQLQYAGANNNLWIVSKRTSLEVNGETIEPVLEMEGTNLFEVKATKQPVGKYLDRKPFENNEVELQKGDTVYMFTDGFADQFGGDKGKKYKYLPFKRFLVGMYDQDLQAQMTSLNDEFYRWKGEIEQIDDVCVIGVRI